jgi:4-hydroxy-tetrahydrodipicolinate synthase
MGGYNTREVIEHIKSADLDGVQGLLSVVPYYNKPTQEGLYCHFMAIAEASPVPILLYNVPSRCGVNMSAETTLRLLNASDKFLGIKEASGNLEQIKTIILGAPANCVVLSGDDGIINDVCSMGGHGVISVMANAFPALTVQLTHKALEKNPEAKAVQDSVAEIIRLLFVEGNPGGVKAFLHQMGMIENVLRLPLVPVSEIMYDAIAKISKEGK